MIGRALQAERAPASPVTVFRRLFENEFATLDGIAISCRSADGIEYIDESVALGLMLTDEAVGEDFVPSDHESHAMHQAMYEAWPDVTSVVSGWSRHLRALLLEEMALPAPTSMMRKRGITDLQMHLLEPSAFSGLQVEATLAKAHETAARNGMAHYLLLATNGMVVVAAPTPEEAMAHWHNVEFAARIECMRIEEAGLRETRV